MDLAAYECRVYVDLGELTDGPRPVRRLAERLGHATTPSVDEALLLLELEPVHAAIRERLAAALDVERAAGEGPCSPPRSGSSTTGRSTNDACGPWSAMRSPEPAFPPSASSQASGWSADSSSER